MARRKKGDPISGWVNLDKPYDMTSTQAIAKLRKIMNCQKIGHAGTLDPLATGILPVAIGEATKTISFVQDALKVYEFTVRWGEQRDTDDMEGKVIATSSYRPTKAEINTILDKYTGEILQTPPLYSAIKINGERAYDLARSGEIPEIKERKVYVEQLELINVRADEADFLIKCGKGTYIRSIARDMGEDLGAKGFVSGLRRTEVGCFNQSSAISLDILQNIDYISARNEALLPLETVLDDIPALDLKEEETARLRNGQVLNFVTKSDFERLTKIGLGKKEIMFALAKFQDRPVALIEQERAEIRPVRVFNI